MSAIGEPDENGFVNYEVDRICDHRGSKENGDLEFFVHWKDYDESQNSWVWDEDMSCALLIAEYFQGLEEAKKRKEEAKTRKNKDEHASAVKKNRKSKEDEPRRATSDSAKKRRRSTTPRRRKQASSSPRSSSVAPTVERESDSPVQSTSRSYAQDLPGRSRESSAGPSSSKKTAPVALKKKPTVPPLPKKKIVKAAAAVIDDPMGEPEQEREKILPPRGGQDVEMDEDRNDSMDCDGSDENEPEAEKIVSIMKKGKKIFAEVKFRGTNQTDVIPYDELKETNPAVVLRYQLRFVMETVSVQ